MNIRYSLPLLLALCATVALFVGCGSAPTSQEAESPAAPQAVPTAAESLPQAKTDVAAVVDTATQAKAEVAPAVDTAPEARTVNVGYEVGMRVPEFEMSLLDGAKVTSAALTEEGKPVFLYFHATF